MSTLLSLGHGYSAAALARRLIPLGWTVIGTTRGRADALRAEGVEPLLWPGDLAAALGRATHILASAAPDGSGDPFLTAALPLFQAARPVWVGYLSTTAVYGDHQGGWVDEDTPLSPGSARAVQRVLAERQWLATGLPVHIFRLAGIYGPGRGPFEKVRDGTARRIIKPGQVFNRIHVDDIAQAVLASFDKRFDGIVNVTDDEPSPAQDVVACAAELLGLPVPPDIPFEESGLSEMGRSFYGECKRVRNERLKGELSVNLLHPNFTVALRALAAGGDGRQRQEFR